MKGFAKVLANISAIVSVCSNPSASFDVCLNRSTAIRTCEETKSNELEGRVTRRNISRTQLQLAPCVHPGGGSPYNGLYGEAPPERGTLFRLEVYKRVGISRAEV